MWITPAFSTGVEHRLGLVAGARERLLADDVLAGLRGGDGDFGVAVVRRDDIDGVDVFARDHAPPVVRGFVEAVALARRLGEFGRHIDDHLAMGNGRRGPEEHRHRRIGQRMGLAHEAAADHRDIEGPGHGLIILRSVERGMVPRAVAASTPRARSSVGITAWMRACAPWSGRAFADHCRGTSSRPAGRAALRAGRTGAEGAGFSDARRDRPGSSSSRRRRRRSGPSASTWKS